MRRNTSFRNKDKYLFSIGIENGISISLITPIFKNKKKADSGKSAQIHFYPYYYG